MTLNLCDEVIGGVVSVEPTFIGCSSNGLDLEIFISGIGDFRTSDYFRSEKFWSQRFSGWYIFKIFWHFLNSNFSGILFSGMRTVWWTRQKASQKVKKFIYCVLIFIVFRCCLSGFSFSHFVQWLKPKLSQESGKKSRENSITKKNTWVFRENGKLCQKTLLIWVIAKKSLFRINAYKTFWLAGVKIGLSFSSSRSRERTFTSKVLVLKIKTKFYRNTNLGEKLKLAR